MSDHRDSKGRDELRQCVESIADQLCQTVDGHFDFRIKVDSFDPTVEKLQLLINFMLDSMHRSTQELEQRSVALQEQVELAQAASRAKADFLANMSHEIRTPLNGIVGLTALIQHTTLTHEQADIANGIRISSDNLLAIINDILDFSKIEAGKLELEQVDFNLHATAQEVAESIAARAAQKGVELIVRYVPGTPRFVQGDESRLRQVLLNLMGNAIKFTEYGHVMMTICQDDAGFSIEIQDTGIGIPRNRQSSLFEEFTQVDSSTTRRYGGTGLGLTISKRIIEAMGGRIELESEEGRGSSFRLHVPLSLCDEPTVPLPTRSIRSFSPRILVVDDSRTNRLVLQELFIHWQVPVDAVASAAAAHEKLLQAVQKGEPYHIAIIDYAMPEEDGVSLAEKIKAGPARDTRLILLSSLGQSFKNEQLSAWGFSGYLLKPASQDVLRDMLRVICAGIEGETIPPFLTRQLLIDQKTDMQWMAQEVEPERLQILVAEDNVVNQKVVKALLERFGHQVYVAHNGLEALELAQRFEVDLVLMDVQMPELNGLDASQELRHSNLARLRKVPIIALTANATTGDRDICLAAGMDDFLSKPFTPDRLQEVLLKWGSSAHSFH